MIPTNQPLVSVCILTYNHQDYIDQAINGALNQVINFPIEIIIVDDFSSDGTREILKQYQLKNSELISIYLNEQNIGAAKSYTKLMLKPKGKYIAYLEGDDCWTDIHKLQIQTDFLESNPQFSMCFHNVELRYENNKPSTLLLQEHEPELSSFRDLAIRNNFLPTCAILYKNKLTADFLLFLETLKIGDWPINLYNAVDGDIKYIPKVMGIYRVHSNGLWSGLNTDEKYFKIIDTIDKLVVYFKLKTNYVSYLEEGRIELTKKYKLQKAASTKTFKALSFIKKILTYCTPYYLVIKFKSK